MKQYIKLFSVFALGAASGVIASNILLKQKPPENEKLMENMNDKRTWKGCCTHFSHGTISESPCVATDTNFNSYQECYDAQKKHQKDNPGHSYGCR